MDIAPTTRPAVFLDRDGTIVRLVDYLRDPERVVLCSGAREGLRALRAAGFLLVQVSNQSGLARGLFGLAAFEQVEDRVAELLGPGAQLDLSLHCPHHPEGLVAQWSHPCSCRKPEPGMVDEACARLPIDRARSYLIGDSLSDMECGRRAGLTVIRVSTGYGGEISDPHSHDFDAVAPAYEARDLADASAWIVSRCA